MKMTLTAFALIALLPAGAVLADDDCRAPRDQWQLTALEPGQTVTAFLRRNPGFH